MEEVRNLSALHEYLSTTVSSPLSFEDVLRSQVVYSVSAFDKLIHDLVRVGIVQVYSGIRAPTPKYLAEPFSMALHQELNSATIPPKEHIFEKAVFDKLKVVSYQHPKKIAEGLSYIWQESQKWQKIAENLPTNDEGTKVKLKLIASRRNSIVHEADMDPITNLKLSISQVDCDDITNFLDLCGSEIFRLVKL